MRQLLGQRDFGFCEADRLHGDMDGKHLPSNRGCRYHSGKRQSRCGCYSESVFCTSYTNFARRGPDGSSLIYTLPTPPTCTVLACVMFMPEVEVVFGGPTAISTV